MFPKLTSQPASELKLSLVLDLDVREGVFNSL